MSNKSPININISDKDISDKYMNNSNDKNNIIYKDYIINLNIELNSENKKLREKLSKTNSTISKNNDEIDKYDNKIRYMKGLLNNLLELKNLYYTLYKLNNTNLYENFKQYKIHKNIIFDLLIKLNICQLFILLSIILIITNYYSNKYIILFEYVLLIFWLYNMINIYTNLYKNYKHFNNNLINNINSLKNNIDLKFKEINELESSTISLDNWICEI